MKLLEGNNVNDLYEKGLRYLRQFGVGEQSRNGRVIVAPGPVISVYHRPRERVLFSPVRDANPFFHLMEAIWMLAGERGSEWPTMFNKQMAAYANIYGQYDGAYGYRWRSQFGFDQIQYVVELLRSDPETRRAVIGMYAPNVDSNNSSLDIPCNTHIYFDCRGDVVNMTVCCRSNDAIWGAYGANAVHMSVLQEVIAAGVNRPVGEYRQFSNNFHVYPNIPRIKECLETIDSEDIYMTHGLTPFPIVNDYGSFLDECKIFMTRPEEAYHYKNSFFYFVARPMYFSWLSHKEGDDENAVSWAKDIEDMAWRYACTKWLQRRMDK